MGGAWIRSGDSRRRAELGPRLYLGRSVYGYMDTNIDGRKTLLRSV